MLTANRLLRRTVIGVASAALFLSGCAKTSVPAKWIGGAGREQWGRDDWECTRDSRTIGPSSFNNPWGADRAERQAQRLYTQCMESKGYTLVCPDGMHLNNDRDKCRPD